MAPEEMTKMVEDLVADERFNGLIPHYLDVAKESVVSHLYPYQPDADWTNVPEKYHARTCEIAVYLVNKRGAEGEIQHTENGINRTYETAAIPKGYFAGMVPFVGIPS